MYRFDFDTLQNNFTMMTDGGAVMAKVADSSVSRNVAALDE